MSIYQVQRPDRDGYRPAAVCRRGHIRTTDMVLNPVVEPMCVTCGAPVLTACASCGFRIRGRFHVEGVVGLRSKSQAPDFCDQCGAPHPWAGRQALIYQLQNLLDDEGLSKADELIVRENLKVLVNADLDEDDQTRRWQKVVKLAPGLMKSGREILVSVVTEATMKALGLKP